MTLPAQTLTVLLALAVFPVPAAVAAETTSGLLTYSSDGRPATVISLDQALTIAMERNRELRGARLAVRAAQAGVTSASAPPNPVFSANTTGLAFSGTRLSQTADTTLRIDQLVERGGKRELRTEAATALLEATRRDEEDVTRKTRMAVAKDYYVFLAARRKIRLLKQISELYVQSLRTAEQRLLAGDVAASDITRLRVEIARARGDQDQAYIDATAAQAALSLDLGRDPSSPLEPEELWPDLTDLPDEVGTLAPRDILRRADVKAATARIEAARRNLDLAHALHTHDLTLGVQYERSPDAKNTVGIGVSMPLFTRYEFQGEDARANADLRNAELALESIVAAAQAEIHQARAALEYSWKKARRYRDEVVPHAQQAADHANFAYTHGGIGLIDLLDARRALEAALLDAETAYQDYATARFAWNSVLGENEAK